MATIHFTTSRSWSGAATACGRKSGETTNDPRAVTCKSQACEGAAHDLNKSIIKGEREFVSSADLGHWYAPLPVTIGIPWNGKIAIGPLVGLQLDEARTLNAMLEAVMDTLNARRRVVAKFPDIALEIWGEARVSAIQSDKAEENDRDNARRQAETEAAIRAEIESRV